jgi:outer membrane protein TolC
VHDDWRAQNHKNMTLVRIATSLCLATLAAGTAPSLLAAQSTATGARPPATAPAVGTPAQPSDTLALSLTDVLASAFGKSEEVRLARSQMELADAQVTATRAQALPQVDGQVSYTRTFESPFSGGGFQLPDSLRFAPDSTLPINDRLRYLEQNAPIAGLGGIGSLFGDLPFGQEHGYTAQIAATQTLYAGGRVGAALKIAKEYRAQSRLGYAEQTAELEFKVKSAYYRAALAQELEGIAQAAVDQAQRFLDEERLRRRAGSVSELEVLRAEVSLENLRPQLVQARNASELAMLDLKRLVNVPLTQPVRLTTALEAPDTTNAAPPELQIAERPAVGVAERQVAIKEKQVSVAKGAFLPSVDLQVRYGRQIFPPGTFNFGGADWRKDFAATIGVKIPLFNGFRTSAQVQQARVELEQSRLQLTQLREAVQLEYEQARGERARAVSSIEARRRTVEQAQRVYDLTVMRYEKGLATQLEASDARLALLQARTNLAQAIADYHIANAQIMKALGQSSAPSR